MSILYATVGLPRAGKSTWAKQQLYPRVNPDSIRLAITGKAFYKPAEGLVWGTTETMVRALFIAGHTEVILDATNISEEARHRWLSPDWETKWIVFRATSEVCRARAVASKREDLLPVIDRMVTYLVWPEKPYLVFFAEDQHART